MNGTTPGFLGGLRVLEFGHIAAAPFAGMLLADLGADVVKVASPDGDGLRAWPPIVESDDGRRFSLNFASLNRNKRSIVADLKDPAQLDRVRTLCAAADVIVENYRPGVMARLGLGFTDVGAMQNRIVYCSVSGYGQTGPYAERGAFDVVVQGMSGLMSVTGDEDGPPAKCGVPVGDFTAGLYAAYAILAARPVALREARPIHIDCAMLDCLLGISALQTSEFWGTGRPPRRLGSAHPRNAPYQAYDASDAPFIIAAGNDRLWSEVCTVVGTPELREDPRFATVSERARNQHELAQILQSRFATKPAAEWLAAFERHGVPCGPVNDFAEALNDPQVLANGLVREMTLPGGVQTKTVAFPLRMTGYAFDVHRSPPELGEHTDEVFAAWLGTRDGSVTAPLG